MSIMVGIHRPISICYIIFKEKNYYYYLVIMSTILVGVKPLLRQTLGISPSLSAAYHFSAAIALYLMVIFRSYKVSYIG